MAPVILSCFAGRQKYLEILKVHVKRLLDEGLIDEFHVWDYSKDPSDTKWIRENFQDKGFRIFSVFSKLNWYEYYEYYTKERFPDPDTVIVKADDDIVFIDTAQFKKFIEFRRLNKEPLLGFASIVNNRVAATIQKYCGLLPDELFSDEEIKHIYESKDTPARLHQFFIENYILFIEASRRLGYLNLDSNEYININFFAILGKDLDVFQMCGERDEFELTVILPKIMKRTNYIDMRMVVSHASFCKQREVGFDDTEIIKKYKWLAHNSV